MFQDFHKVLVANKILSTLNTLGSLDLNKIKLNLPL